jgi:hypothetical protein
MLKNDSLLVTGGTKENRDQWAHSYAKNQSSQFDTITINANEQRGIETIRELLQLTARKPFAGEITTVIITEADNLTVEAQNALLKILEEPPEHSQLILCVQSKNNLLSTVTSRCLQIEVGTQGKQPETFQSLLNQPLSQQIESIEEANLGSYLNFWRVLLREKILSKEENNFNLRRLWSYTKLIIKLRKAQKFSINKKLIALILALEIPKRAEG